MREFTGRSSPGREVRRSRSAVCAAAVAGALLAGPSSAAEEKPADIIAAHIRQQGFACDNPLRAERNRKASKPNETVWTLRCSNGTYRVRLVPDMAAHVEPVQPDKSN